MRQRLDDTEHYRSLFQSGLKYGSLTYTLAADNSSVDLDMPPFLIIDPDGAKDLLLPAEADSKGYFFWIYNAAGGAENITVKDDSDTNTIVTIGQGNFGFVICDGTTWRGAVFDQTVAGSLASLSVSGASTFTGLAKSDVGFQVNDTAVIATADGLTTGLIAAGTGFVSVSNATDANDIATLPAGTAANVGMSIWGWSTEAHELRTPASSGATINGVDADGTQEAAIPATTLWEARLVAVDTWILRAWDELGAPITAIVPD